MSANTINNADRTGPGADGILIDIDGVLTLSWTPIDGASEALEILRRSGLPLRFATNTTTRTRAEIARRLTEIGMSAEPDEILTAPAATAAHLRRHHPGARCLLLNEGDLSDDLGDIEFVDFVAMHHNLSWRTAEGFELDAGAYVEALRAATGTDPTVVGKPSPAFFRAGVAELGVDAERVVMVGDDIDNDVLAAQEVGLRGVLVRTGKFRQEALAGAARRPDVVVDSFAGVPSLLGMTGLHDRPDLRRDR